MSQLSSISPIDGRYHKQTQNLSGYFSEFGLIKYRVLVEVHYFLFLADQLSRFLDLGDKFEVGCSIF